MKPIAIAAVAIGYLYFFPYFAHLRNPNENVRVYMVLAVIDHGTFAVNRVIAERGPVDDRATNLSQTCAGALGPEPCTYSSKAPGLSYLGIPVYAVLRLVDRAATGRQPEFATTIYVLRLFCVILPTLIFLWAFWRFLGGYLRSEFDRVLIVGVLALGTTCFTYAHMFAGHQLAAVLVFGSFMFIERARRSGDAGYLLSAGFAAAFAAITEYPAALAAPILFAYAIARFERRRRHAAALFVAGGIAPVLLGAFYHQICFGRPWRTGYSMLANRAYASFHRAGFFGVELPSMSAGWHGLFSPAIGLFFFSPFLLIAVAGLAMLWRLGRRAEAVLASAIVIVGALYQSAVNPEIGGWSLGPRYIVFVTPFLAFAAAGFLEATRDRWAARYLVVIPLAVLSIAYTFVSTIVFHTFPTAFTNPFYEWVLPLARMGYFNYNAGTWIGLRGVVSALPGLVAVGLLLLTFVVGPSSFERHLRVAGCATAVLVVSAWLTAFSHAARFDSAEKDGEFHRLVVLWEPPPVTDLDIAIAQREADAHPDAADAQAHLGELLARRGRSREALARYETAAGELLRRKSSRTLGEAATTTITQRQTFRANTTSSRHDPRSRSS